MFLYKINAFLVQISHFDFFTNIVFKKSLLSVESEFIPVL